MFQDNFSASDDDFSADYGELSVSDDEFSVSVDDCPLINAIPRSPYFVAYHEWDHVEVIGCSNEDVARQTYSSVSNNFAKVLVHASDNYEQSILNCHGCKRISDACITRITELMMNSASDDFAASNDDFSAGDGDFYTSVDDFLSISETPEKTKEGLKVVDAHHERDLECLKLVSSGDSRCSIAAYHEKECLKKSLVGCLHKTECRLCRLRHETKQNKHLTECPYHIEQICENH